MRASRRISRPAFAALLFLVPAAASLTVPGAWTATVAGPSGPLSTTTSGESVQVLNVLKVQRGLPLYDRPSEPPYHPTTLYDAGSYGSYAAATRRLPASVADRGLGMRLFTLVLASLGLAATLAYGLLELRRRRPTRGGSTWTAARDSTAPRRRCDGPTGRSTVSRRSRGWGSGRRSRSTPSTTSRSSTVRPRREGFRTVPACEAGSPRSTSR